MDRGSERRGRPPSFTRDELIAAARRVGPEEISLPVVARQLGVSRTSLYWHVRDASELGEAVLAGILAADTAPRWRPDPARGWRDELATYARSVRARLVAAGGWTRFATPRNVLAPAQLRAMEVVVARLREAGLSDVEAAHAYTHLLGVVLAGIRPAGAPLAGMYQALADQLGEAGPDYLPRLRELAAAADRTSAEDQFEYDLDCALRGIAARSTSAS